MTRRIVMRRPSRRRTPLGYWGFTVLTVVSILLGNLTTAAVTATLAYCLRPSNGGR
jgi:hypothetical protein